MQQFNSANFNPLFPKIGGSVIALALEYVVTALFCSPVIFLFVLIMFDSWRGLFQATGHALRSIILPEPIYIIKYDYWEDRLAFIKLLVLALFSSIGIYIVHNVFFEEKSQTQPEITTPSNTQHKKA